MRGQIVDFLNDADKSFLDFHKKDRNVRLLKSEYNSELDFLYMISAFDPKNPHRIGENAEFAGVYHRKSGKVYEASWPLRDALGYDFIQNGEDSICLPIGKAIDRTLEMAKSIALEAVKAGDISAPTEIPESIQRRMEYFEKYDLAEEAARCFYERKTAEFNPWIEKNAIDMIESIITPEAEARRIAQDFMQKHHASIYNRLQEVDRVNAEAQRLEATPGIHHSIREISESIGDAQSVWLDICKNDKEVSCKIAGREMKAFRFSGEYSTYQMDAPSRRIFDAAFGKHSRLYVQDIVRIRYGKKVLYEKAADSCEGRI